MSDKILVRTYSAGVWVGELVGEIKDQIATLKNARNLWYWDGAASLSQLAMEGVKSPDNCKFPCPVDTVTLYQVVQTMSITKIAEESIDRVAVWSH